MHFSPVVTHGWERRLRYWLYKPSDAADVPAGDVVNAIFEAEAQRPIFGNVARAIHAFSIDAEQRNTLGHDCAVFALACLTQKDYRGVTFWRSRNALRINVVGSRGISAEEANKVPAGKVICARSYTPGLHHFFVAASNDELQPRLFAAKQGIEGPVVLGSYEQIVDGYNVDFIQSVDGLQVASLG